ncbi:MAG: HAMP domain-containing histidine kinase [Planctomycetes bacterium]|nr:HAMP domain-containing histidine kinase [Planctomycetota bacterium]
MSRSPSSLLFLLILGLSVALVLWWTIFQVHASGELAAAGQALIAGDIEGAAHALGAADAADLAVVAQRRRWMFGSEGTVFGLTLLGAGWLYTASVRREAKLRTAQDRFLAAATHELKTPLATIVLLLESLRDGRLPDDKRARYLATGLLEAERLERGLDNVLMAAGLRTTAKATRPQPGDLVSDVRQAVQAMQPRALATQVEIRTELPGNLALRRDAAAMQMVLRNLLDNAVKYSPAGGVVHVELQRREDEARIVVRDAGRGMDADELQHAFTPFWRGSDNATGGSGLGLHLVRELVLAHGGAVSVHSDGRGRGCEIAVRLPLGRTE